MLDTRFPRIVGDIGNPASFPFPVLYRRVAEASPDRVVRGRGEGLLPAFVEAGLGLVEDGARGISTSCGFLTLFQRELASRLPVPVYTSALLQVRMVAATLPPDRRVGVLTISKASLKAEHLRAADVPDGTPIGTTEGGQEFTQAILSDAPDFDVAAARADNVAAAMALKTAHEDLGAIVLECTNMGPYAGDIARATGLPVYSILTGLAWFQASLKDQ